MQYASSSTVSARWVWSVSPSRRASSADSVMRLLRHGERRARGDRDLDTRARAGLVQLRDEPLGVGEHRVDVLDELVRRQAAVGDAEVHRAARGDDPDAELARRLHLGLDQARAPPREDVVMVEHGRAAGQRELGEPGARRRVLGLRVDPRPHRVELAKPVEQVGLLRARARERLVQVVVGVDEARGDDRAAQVDALVRRPARSPEPTAVTTPSSTSEPAGLVLRPRVVTRHDPAVDA